MSDTAVELYVQPEGENSTVFDARCVATTAVDADGAEVDSVSDDADKELHSNYFKSAQWTPDGTTVITNSADNCIRTFVIPPDLLDKRDRPHDLNPYHSIPSNDPVYSLAINPFYNLSDPTSTYLLSGVRDHPIKLHSTLYPGLISSYSLVSPTTEAFITPHSLLFPASLGGTHFLAGSDSLICLFDVSRPGKDGPISRLPTIPSKRKKIVGGGVGMKGIVSTMAVDTEGGSNVLAAGTFTRHVGLYANNGDGDTIATFTIAGTPAEREIGGRGVTQIIWSPCGRYLYVAERRSDGILVYDIRVTGRLAGWLGGRKSVTNQRLSIDIASVDDGLEVWAGGTDGYVRMWKNPVAIEGGMQPTWEKRLHGDPISSAVLHPTARVMATCSGQKQYPDFLEDGDEAPRARTTDNSLKLWDLDL